MDILVKEAVNVPFGKGEFEFARIMIGRAGATVYDRYDSVVAVLSTPTMDRIVKAWADRTPPLPYHFIGAEAERCA